ncbi:hypothetical protein MSAN_00289600 [Mycena sanguinolenta]|uniref:Uncharacterized protein n=1 Tax=Mycena sanguinolenta TaxID=230812 RepID=A0A8H6ZBZ9_9AGAR|nr:hypothetical protein MSAN_00289600 [Mycena sanguinolenta]
MSFSDIHAPITNNAPITDNVGDNSNNTNSNNTTNSFNTTIHGVAGRPPVSFGGAFYAYIHDISNERCWRMVIIFASRVVADEWWRAMSTSTIDFLKNNIQRITPQFYTHNTAQWNFYTFFSDKRVRNISDKFRGKMFIVLEHDHDGRGITIIPLQSIVDHASGDWFSIRSKANASQYWYYDETLGCITISEIQRTSFRITSVNMHEGAIMVKADQITLTVQGHGFVVPRTAARIPGSLTLGVTNSQAEAFRFKFEDLDRGCFNSVRDGLRFVVCYVPGGGGNLGWELSL